MSGEAEESALQPEGYRILERIGRGADGQVFRAARLARGDEVALKVLTGEEGLAHRRGRMERSAALVMGLQHPAIAEVLEVGELPDKTPWLAMELVQGRPLSALLKEGPLAPRRACALIRQALEGLGAAHDRGVIHRDIKPHNLMVTTPRDGRPEALKIVDFGLARIALRGDEAPEAANLTSTGQVLGTPRYMAPEQVDFRAVCPASDLYSLGLVFFELLTGRPAVEGTTTWQILLRQLEPFPVIDVDDPAIPPPLRPVLARAVQKKLERRVPDAAAFLAALDDALLQPLPEAPAPAAQRLEPPPVVSPARSSLPTLPTVAQRVGGRPAPPAPAPPAQVEEFKVGFAMDLPAERREGSPPPAPRAPAPRPLAPPAPASSPPALETLAEAAAAPPRPRSQAPAAPQRRRGLVWGVLGGVLLGLAGVAWWWWSVGVYGGSVAAPAGLEARGWQACEVAREGGGTLAAWYLPAAGETRAGLLALHGLNPALEADAAMLEELRGQGIAVLLLAQRGYGGSEGSPDPALWTGDASAAWAELGARTKLPPARRFLLGRGLGAAAALALATRDPGVGGVILEEPHWSPGEAASARSGGLLPAMLWGGDAAGVAVGATPTLWLHAAGAAVPAEEAARRRLGASAQAPVELDARPLGARRYAYRLALFMAQR